MLERRSFASKAGFAPRHIPSRKPSRQVSSKTPAKASYNGPAWTAQDHAKPRASTTHATRRASYSLIRSQRGVRCGQSPNRRKTRKTNKQCKRVQHDSGAYCIAIGTRRASLPQPRTGRNRGDLLTNGDRKTNHRFRFQSAFLFATPHTTAIIKRFLGSISTAWEEMWRRRRRTHIRHRRSEPCANRGYTKRRGRPPSNHSDTAARLAARTCVAKRTTNKGN